MLCLKDQKFFITIQDKETKIQEWNIEFIVDVQSLAQHAKGKWWRNQPRWLVRGTKQALVKRRLTMCASAKVKCKYPLGVRSIISKPWLREAM